MGEKHHKTEGRHKPDRDHAYFDRLEIQRQKRTGTYLDPQSVRPPEVERALHATPTKLQPVKKRKK